MSLQINKESGVKYDPIFLKIIEDIPGGVTFVPGDLKSATVEVKAGAVIGEDGSTELWHLVKTAVVQTEVAGAAITVQVEKNHEFKVEDFITNGAVSTAITVIDDSNSAFDTITITATLDATVAVPIGTVLYQGTDAGVTPKYPADAILRDTAEVKDEKGNLLGNIFAGAVVRGTVDESELPYSVTDGQKVSLTDRIRFA